MTYVIGVDAGGTKTDAACFDRASGRKIYEARGGPGNCSVDFEGACGGMEALIAACLARCGAGCALICVGAAGLGTPGMKRRLRERLAARFAPPLRVMDDGELMLCAALGGGEGVLAVGGTGSIAYARRGGQLYRCGGWGHLLDDRGSGYDVVIRAFRLMAEACDEGAAPSMLTRALLAALGAQTVREAVPLIYQARKDRIAALLPAVEREASSGDGEAERLLDGAGRALAGMIGPLMRRFPPGPVQVRAAGGTLLHCPAVYGAFLRETGRLYPAALVAPFDGEPAAGALCCGDAPGVE